MNFCQGKFSLGIFFWAHFFMEHFVSEHFVRNILSGNILSGEILWGNMYSGYTEIGTFVRKHFFRKNVSICSDNIYLVWKLKCSNLHTFTVYDGGKIRQHIYCLTEYRFLMSLDRVQITQKAFFSDFVSSYDDKIVCCEHHFYKTIFLYIFLTC